jgi:hypothetical protein
MVGASPSFWTGPRKLWHDATVTSFAIIIAERAGR